MIIKYYKGNEDINSLIEKTKTNQEGTTAYNLMKVAQTIGFDTKGIETIDYSLITYPAIAHIKTEIGYHYVVIYKNDQNKNQLLIADPREKITTIKEEEFRKMSTNIFLVFKPFKKIEYKKNDKNNKTLKLVLKKVAKEILHLILITIILTIMTLITMFIYRIVLEKPIQLEFFCLLGILLIIKNFTIRKKEMIVYSIGQKIDNHIITMTYRKAIFSPYRFFLNHHKDDLSLKIVDAFNIKDHFVEIVLFTLNFLILVVPSLVIMILIDKKITTIYIVTVVLYVLAINIKSKDINENLQKIYDSFKTVTEYISKSLYNFETIQNLNKHKESIREYHIKMTDHLNTNKRETMIIINDMFINQINNDLIQICFLYYILIQLSQNVITISEAFSIYYLILIISNEVTNIKQIIISIKKMNYLLTKINSFKGKINTSEKKQIYYHNFNYYIENKLLLTKINFKVKQGEKVAILGENGSGKTTLMRIIKGYYKNQNHNNVLMLTADDADNQKNFSKPDNEERKIFNLNFEIINDEKYLSGGQKQKLLLCEMFRKKAKIYILDEATNKIDHTSERKILKNIITKYKTKTIIYITHKKDNLDLFEKKYYFKKGGKNVLDCN
jgi:ABC-type bacteriocin/lantibiotic exporter with double-glycine peptidase domain